MRNQLEAASQHLKITQDAQAKKYEESSRRRLQRIMEKKLSTSFIGALARFESVFGHLWGHGKHDSELTENEQKWLDLWIRARKEVLTNGNNQIRAIQEELQQYDVRWNGYQAVLTPQS